MNKAKFLFGDIVVVNECHIGVILKTWERADRTFYYEIYVRLANRIIEYEENSIERYRVRHKYLSEEELNYQNY